MPFDGPLPHFEVRADFWSLRFVDEYCETYAVRKNVPMPYIACTDRGVMATAYVDGGYGYAATGDTSPEGLHGALERAARWARATATMALFDSRALPQPIPRGTYASPSLAEDGPSRRDWYDLLALESQRAGCDPRIVDWEAGMEVRTATHRLVTSTGGDVVQQYRFLFPNISVTAHAGATRRPGHSTVTVACASKAVWRFFAASGSSVRDGTLPRRHSSSSPHPTARAVRWMCC